VLRKMHFVMSGIGAAIDIPFTIGPQLQFATMAELF